MKLIFLIFFIILLIKKGTRSLIPDDDSSRRADDGCSCRNIPGHNRVCANLRIVSDADVSQNFGSGADHDIVSDRRMAFAVLLAGSSQRRAMVHRAVVADDRRFPDHHAHAVVDEESFPDIGGGMNFDAVDHAHEIHDALSKQLQFYFIEKMGDAVPENRLHSGIEQNDLQIAPRCRISFFD